jgi:hypothetical protein
MGNPEMKPNNQLSAEEPQGFRSAARRIARGDDIARRGFISALPDGFLHRRYHEGKKLTVMQSEELRGAGLEIGMENSDKGTVFPNQRGARGIEAA